MLLHDLINRFGPVIVFANTLGAALGLPLPAMPTLIVVGASIALAAQGLPLHLAGALLLAIAGGVLGDLVWFQGGRRYGDRTLKTLCKLSLSRDTCVKKTERFFGRWGVRVLFVAKFIPGLSLVSVPLAGAMGVPLRSFVTHDATGVGLWAAVGLLLGVLFAPQLDLLMAVLAQFGQRAGVLAALLLLAYIGYRWWRRRALMGALEKSRITVDELYALMQDEPLPTIFDLRSMEKRLLDPFIIPGSLSADERELEQIVQNYHPDDKIVIYCSCPNEVSAAWMAKALGQRGFRNVVPLTGGIDAWRLAGFELATLAELEAGFVMSANSPDGTAMGDFCAWPARPADR